MLTPKTDTAGGFVPAADLGAGVAVAVASPVPQIKTRTREVGFQVLTGSPGTLLESLEAGAGGAVLGFAACAPQACQEIYLAWKDHDRPLAMEKQKRIAGASQRIAGALGIPGIKYGCDFNGYFGGRARSPLLPLTGEEKAEVERLLVEIRN
jgi:dihydrodipicolinate synthase/N-acetylneuraminate lyase